MKEIHKLLSFSIYISPGRRYVFLGSTSMDMQIAIKDTGIEFICPQKKLFMTKFYNVIMNCFMFAAFFVQFPLCGY